MQNKSSNIGFYVYEDFQHSTNGSSSFITTANGTAVQHLQYLPLRQAQGSAFGESFVSQTSSSWESRYTFSGKEKDANSKL